MKLWYLFQGSVFTGITYFCESSPDPNLHPSDAFVILFAAGITYLLTRCISTVHDLLWSLLGWGRRRLSLLSSKPSQSPSEQLLITKGSLRGKRLIGNQG
jgi:hypothetical protein